MWGMHSIRETGGVIDGVYYRDLFTGFYKEFEHINHDLLNQWVIITKWSQYLRIIISISNLNALEHSSSKSSGRNGWRKEKKESCILTE